jgi:hypothetical protein
VWTHAWRLGETDLLETDFLAGYWCVPLGSVAREYRRALANPQTRRRATQTVANKLGYERGHITRLLTEARKLGLLGPARRGQAGEADLAEPSGSREGTT